MKNVDELLKLLAEALSEENDRLQKEIDNAEKCKCGNEPCTCLKEDYNDMRYIIRIFKVWYKNDCELFAKLMEKLTLEEMQMIQDFAADVLETYEAETAKEEDEELKVNQKVAEILCVRKAKYPWVECKALYNLVCTTPDIDPHDPRVDEAVNTDFFSTCVKKLKEGETFEIDYHDYSGLQNYIAENFNNYAISFVNGKVEGKIG